MEPAYIVFGVLLVTFLLFVSMVVRAVRAVKRGAERARQEVRRTISDATLTARAAQPGPVGELARARRELRASIDGTRRVLEGAVGEDPALRESLALLDQLHEHARQLDREFAALAEGEPDRGRIAALMPELRERSRRIRASADSLRFAAQDRTHRHDADGLDALHQQIDLEAQALRHWTSAVGPGEERAPGLSPGAEAGGELRGGRAGAAEPLAGAESRWLSGLRKRRPHRADG